MLENYLTSYKISFNCNTVFKRILFISTICAVFDDVKIEILGYLKIEKPKAIAQNFAKIVIRF